jgi:isoleucyl-tRNA synthetase
VTISASGETFDLLERHDADLPMLFIVSSVSLEPRDAAVNLERRGAAGSSEIVHVDVLRASGDKCPRCWRFVSDAATTGDLAGLCSRCVAALGGNPVAATR